MKNIPLIALLISLRLFLAHSPAHGQERFSFVVSGGVSLGSYEAGMSWALLKAMKLSRAGVIDLKGAGVREMPELVSVAGASAGGINVLAASLAWCADDSKAGLLNSPEDNVFRSLWLDVGIDDLMPPDVKTRLCTEGDDNPSYCGDDALLSRKKLREKERLLAEAVSKPLFKPGCEVRIAFTVTRTVPEVLTIRSATGRSIKVENERFVIPLALKVGKEGWARFENFESIGGYEQLGNVIFLRRASAGSPEVSMEDVLAAIEATSAFPIAFSNRWLDYCRRADAAQINPPGGVCPEGFVESGAFFVDGGVFDNKPLGVAREIAEFGHEDACPAGDGGRGCASEYSYIYIDPGSRRLDSHPQPAEAAALSEEETRAASLDLLSQLNFITGAISSGLQYELYNEVRSGEWTGREGRDLLIPSRFPAITGQYLEHFGAFLDISFRQYDYYAGVYDAVHAIASYLCMGPGARADPSERMACYETMRAGTFKALRLGDDIRAAWVFDCLAEHERRCSGETASPKVSVLGLPACTPPEAPARHGFYAFRKCGIEEGFAPLAGDVGENLRAVLWGLNSQGCADPGFERFLQSLCVWFNPAKADNRTINTVIGRHRQGNMLKIMLPLASRASLRQIEIEKDAYERWKERDIGRKPDNTVRVMAGIAAYRAGAALEDEKGAVLSRSSAQGRGYGLLPYEISKNISARGWSVAWEARLRMSPRYSLNIKLAPYAYEGVGDRTVHYAMAAPYLVKKLRWGIAAGAGPALTRTWGEYEDIDRLRLGGAAFVGFADIVRFTVGKRSFFDGSTEDDWYYMLGITDISGLVYWAKRVVF